MERGKRFGELLDDADQNGGNPGPSCMAGAQKGGHRKAFLVKHEQRVIDVVPVVSVEQSELLIAVRDEIGRIEVEHDPWWSMALLRTSAQTTNPEVEQHVREGHQITPTTLLEP